MKARDLMIPLHDVLSPSDTLKTAVNKMRKARRDELRIGVKGLPVQDDCGRLVGMLSMGDILKAVFPSYMSLMDLGDFTWDGMVESLAKKVSDKTVESVMTREVVTVSEDAPLMECVDHMLKKDVKRLVVLNAQGKMTGMLYERDIFFVITKSMLERPREKSS